MMDTYALYIYVYICIDCGWQTAEPKLVAPTSSSQVPAVVFPFLGDDHKQVTGAPARQDCKGLMATPVYEPPAPRNCFVPPMASSVNNPPTRTKKGCPEIICGTQDLTGLVGMHTMSS